MTKQFPPIIATFRTEAEAQAFVRGVTEGMDYFSTKMWTERTTYIFGLLTGEWRAEIGVFND
jgi:hypothetical protein